MNDWNDDHAPCYCLACCTVVDEHDPECGGCGRSFAGTGRFDRIMGTPPAHANAQSLETFLAA